MMKNVRLRRLQSDYESMRRLVRLHPKIGIEGVSGNPPDRYRLILKVRSLRERAGAIEPALEHRVEVALPQGYPRDPPLVRMLTPVFHPNIAPHAVCVGDHWSAAEALDALVQRVGEMLAYQSYNTKSPLNGQAAQWVDSNPGEVPTDREEFFVDLSRAPVVADAGAGCKNCGAKGVPLAQCAVAGHLVCGDCTHRCPTCGQALCLACNQTVCRNCQPAETVTACQNCAAQGVQLYRCPAGHVMCQDCMTACRTCGRAICLGCGQTRCPTCPPS